MTTVGIRGTFFDFVDDPWKHIGNEQAAARFHQDGLMVVTDGVIKAFGPYDEDRRRASGRRDHPYQGPHHRPGLHRRPHPSAADPRARCLWRAAAAVAPEVDLPRGDQVQGSQLRARRREAFSRRTARRRHHHLPGLHQLLAGRDRRAVRGSGPPQHARDRGPHRDRPQRAGRVHRHARKLLSRQQAV